MSEHYMSSGERHATKSSAFANTENHICKNDLRQMAIKKKLVCPTCRSSKSTIYIYEGAPTSGRVSQKCSVCGHLLFIDYGKMTLQDTES